MNSASLNLNTSEVEANFVTTLETTEDLYAERVNKQWVKLLRTLGLNKKWIHCEGTELTDQDGRKYLDFLSGYGVYNIGHHHPQLQEALVDELSQFGPTMLQSYVPELAAQLAERLCTLAGGRLKKVFFTSSGSEGVETVIKFARAFTKRNGILYSNGGFHGLTCGALSLMSNEWWREGFGPMLADTTGVPFGDLNALEAALATGKYAAFITEPIQGESGVVVPTNEFMTGAQALCRKHGTLFVLDEVQTGIYRTGKFLAAQHFGVEPDMVVLAKAMSGGFVPVGAVLMTKQINEAVYSSLDRAFIHASTFGENVLAMRAALATLDVAEKQQLGARAIALGQLLRIGLNGLRDKYEMLGETRGVGLFNGIEFQAPRSVGLKLLNGSFAKLHPGLFGQMAVKHLFEHSQILTQMCGNNYSVVKACPPLVVTKEQIDRFISAVDHLLDTVHNQRASFWPQGLVIAKRALA